MQVFCFHLMPWAYLPEDFSQSHKTAWVTCPNSLYDPDWPEDQRPCVVGRQPFGRISIANSDADAFAYTNAAIDQAFRAVKEISRFGMNGRA